MQILDAIAADGYALIEALKPDTSAEDIFDSIGAVDALESLSRIQILNPKAKSAAPPNTYSGNFGLSRFPLHTDLAHWAIPPRYIALRNIGEQNAVPTLIADTRQIVRAIGAVELRRALVTPRRPLNGQKMLLRLAESESEGAMRVRWDQVFLRPASRHGEQIVQAVCHLVANMNARQCLLAKSGDTLILDNWRMLHGRGNIPVDGMNRTLARCYLSKLYD